ncbi:MAG: hypothetical protein ABI386_04460 [Rhodanobacter sp.]
MLWWALAALFAWLGLHEIYYGVVTKPGFSGPQPIFKLYVAVTLAIAVVLAYVPARKLFFERFLTSKARILSGSNQARVHCNTLFDTWFDPNSLASGHANPQTGQIVLQAPWCGALMDHLRHPERMDTKGIFSVQMFAHEAMHVRGELNEAVTECQAVQRHYRAARLLGIPDAIARKNSVLFYETQYKARGKIGGFQGAYYSNECAPGKQLDEHLEDSTWNFDPH